MYVRFSAIRQVAAPCNALSHWGEDVMLCTACLRIYLENIRKLEGHSVERMYLRQSCSDGSR